eukprot:TRINITY_DN1755_c0_g1_i1.p1 TRINITY_DN1755_c0_g1~~TRINITY_DN1755_c0_g1_i1.p1  ORF type:complete len:960 (+),score=259.04 TRINITY_DN1755_c0_g1_i1:141-3020(+)
MKIILLAIFLFAYHAWAVRPLNSIVLSNFNLTYMLANETYEFNLIPKFQVPLNVYRHTIYTATSDTVMASSKRTLMENQHNVLEVSPQEYEELSVLFNGEVPHVKVNSKKKRALEPLEGGLRVIPLTSKGHAIFHDVDVTQKRSAQGGSIRLGGTFCLHVAFATSCNNEGDLDSVKSTLTTAQEAFYTEIDSYKKTNDMRYDELAKTLTLQKGLISSLATQNANQAVNIARISSNVALNTANIQHGDYIIHSQLSYLKRVTDSLLRYTNALTGTDPRSVVAQPAMGKLFDGFLRVMTYLTTQSTPTYIPIVDTDTFDFSETLLPNEVISNITTSNGAVPTSYGIYSGVGLFIAAQCNVFMSGSRECSDADIKFTKTYASDYHWFYGPFHAEHTGIFRPYFNSTVDSDTITIRKPWQFRDDVTIEIKQAPSQINCVQFFGYKVLATFTSTPNLINGIPKGASPLPLSDCNAYLLRTPIGTPIHYRLFGVYEGVVIPFYSNCEKSAFVSNVKPSIQIGWFNQYPAYTDGAADYTTFDISTRHQVSASCYINVDPGWLGLSYYINNNPRVIPKIPSGYRINQFTINPEGELSSSLEFVYTSSWVWVYQIARTSSNAIITDEVSELEGDLVLFQLDSTKNKVVDESDAFFGEGNNGRDCIRKADHYDYDVNDCFFQNDQKAYTANEYLTGLVKTTGIARYTNKYDFLLSDQVVNNQPSYSFTLKPKNDADFNFYIEMDGAICPKMVNRVASPSGCKFTFFYKGLESATLEGNSVINMNFVKTLANVSTSFGVWHLKINNKECLLVNCLYETTTSTVSLQTPNVQIVSADDVAVGNTVFKYIDESLNNTLTNMANVKTQALENANEAQNIISALASIDFNVTKLFPYEDFSALRASVYARINNISGTQEDSACPGIFGGIECFFKDFASRLITIGIILAVVVGSYFVCFKLGLYKRICSSSDRP